MPVQQQLKEVRNPQGRTVYRLSIFTPRANFQGRHRDLQDHTVFTEEPLTVSFAVRFMHFCGCFNQGVSLGCLLERAGGSPNFTRRSLGSGRIEGFFQVLHRYSLVLDLFTKEV